MQGAENIELTKHDAGVILQVKAVPGSSRDRIAGVLGGRLKINVTAAPEKGRANKAIAAVLAKALGVPGGDVSLHSRPSSPMKAFLIAGLTPEQLRKHLADL